CAGCTAEESIIGMRTKASYWFAGGGLAGPPQPAGSRRREQCYIQQPGLAIAPMLIYIFRSFVRVAFIEAHCTRRASTPSRFHIA
ncbi:hypothetical protein, partial [Bradyrhizobium guangdongense]|uniref:hypothetical protein n=1 Tax=Bradyrhizobium guangdongense TaxID=1325090 RepID=UPI001AECCA32